MNPRRKKRLMTVLTVLTGFACVVALVLYSLSKNVDFFYTPSEILAGKGEQKLKPEIGQRLRVGGLVVPGTVNRDNESLKVSFQLVDSQQVGLVSVEYEGILPDLFREGQGIIALGHLTADNRVTAIEVLAKHDENYMPPEVAEAVKGIKHQAPTYQSAASSDSKPSEGQP